MRNVFLKAELGAELQDAGRASLCLDPAEGARCQVHDRVAPVEVVEQVERFQPEFQIPAGAEAEHPRQRDIDIPVTGTPDAVAREVPKRAQRRLCKGGGVQVLTERLVLRIGIVQDR